MKGDDAETDNGQVWFIDDIPEGKQYDYAIVIKFTNPLGAGVSQIKYQASGAEVLDKTDKDGVTYYILAVNEKSTGFKVWWSAAESGNEYQQPLEVKIDWQAN